MTYADTRAHPRSRGEHRRVDAETGEAYGSSPLTRGAPQASISALDKGRLIPAHAGSTPPSRGPTLSSPAHPRSRGEHAGPDGRPIDGIGSSPLTRGALA